QQRLGQPAHRGAHRHRLPPVRVHGTPPRLAELRAVTAAHPLPAPMARIAFAWELGGEYGHAMACAALARALSLRGHAIAFMFRELRQLAVLPETSAYDIFQAPRYALEGRLAGAPASYADILLGCGYADARELTELAQGWRAL